MLSRKLKMFLGKGYIVQSFHYGTLPVAVPVGYNVSSSTIFSSITLIKKQMKPTKLFKGVKKRSDSAIA